MAKKATPGIATVLSFERKISPSDGYFFATKSDDRLTTNELSLLEKSVRGTISNRLKKAVKGDPAKLNAEVEKTNLQTIDSCYLPLGFDTLKVVFTLKFLGGVAKPSACNSETFLSTYKEAISAYISEHKMTELGVRYATNIANARFLWRNRVGAEAIDVEVTDAASEKTWRFDAFSFSMKNFDRRDDDLLDLASKISGALSSEEDVLTLEVACYAKIGEAQEVYPSEELVLGRGRGDKSKVLYSRDSQACMHSQKIGNAIRTIDTWYADFGKESGAGPIAVEPYGAVTSLGKAFRSPAEKQDFYTHFDVWSVGEKLPSREDEHYVVAVLVRGGVFGQSGKE